MNGTQNMTNGQDSHLFLVSVKESIQDDDYATIELLECRAVFANSFGIDTKCAVRERRVL